MANWPPANNKNKGVIPAQAGIQNNIEELDSRLRRNDKNGTFYFLTNLITKERGLSIFFLCNFSRPSQESN